MKRNIYIFFITLTLLSNSILIAQTSAAKTKQYPSIQIGNQVWMTVNWNRPMPKSWYSGNDSIANAKYGRLYYYSNAVEAAPKGWHLPSIQEWTELINNLGGFDKAGTALMDSTGMHLLLGGNKSANISPEDMFGFMGEYGFYWTSTTDGEQTAYAIKVEKGNPAVDLTSYRRANGFAVRYIKDK